MIRLEKLEMTYSNGHVGLHETSIQFRKGDFTVLLGTSGAGKSTLLRCMNFLNRPTAGKVVVDGIGEIPLVGKRLREHRRNSAMVFQQHQLIGRHSAMRNVLIGRLSQYGFVRSLFPLPEHERMFALECLDRVGLLDKAPERADSLSGGQQQRVGIARALAQRPKIILADEPVASLDPATSERVLSLLHSVTKEDGITAVVSLHQLEHAKKYADRIVGLSLGRVVFDGKRSDLTDDVIRLIYDTSSAKEYLAA